MILQLAVLLLSLALFTALGLPVAARLRHGMPAMVLATPVFGAAILGIAATVLYVWGLGATTIGILALAAALLSLVLYRAAGREMLGAAWRRPGAALVFLLCSLVIASPLLTGGPEFSVVQGNQWDHFNYVTSAVVFSKLPFRAVLDATPEDILANPLLVIARQNSLQRPTIHILLAVIGTLLPGSIAGGGYALLCSFAISGLLAVAGFLRQLFDGAGRAPPIIVALLAGACACGFWGQYPLDIDAWSQVAAAPPLLAAWGMVLAILTRPADADAVDRPQIVALGLLIAGALYFYPEGSLFNAPMLAVMLLAAGRFALRQARPLGAALAIGLGLPLLFWQGIYRQAAAQSQYATSVHVDWWRYFDGYLFGLDPQHNQALQLQLSRAVQERFVDLTQIAEPVAALLNGIGGLFGMYFLTPEHFDQPTLWDAAKGVLLLLALVGIVLSVRAGLKRGPRAYRLLLVGVAAGLFGALLLTVEGQLWQAGKALTYTAPLLCLALVAPALADRRGVFWILPWCLAQGCFVILLLVGLGDPAGIRLQPPYPEAQDPGFKAGGRLRIDEQMAALHACPVVRIIAPDPFVRDYFAVALYEAGRPFFYSEPVDSYLGAGKKLGSMVALPVPRHCEMVQKGAPRQERLPGPPAEVDGFPAGLMAKDLLFTGVSQDGWLAGKARTRLWRPGGSDRLHLAGEIPDFSARITGGTMTVTVDGSVVLERPETAGTFDLTVPIAPASGPRTIELTMTGTDHLPDGRLVAMQLRAIGLEGPGPAVPDDDD